MKKDKVLTILCVIISGCASYNASSLVSLSSYEKNGKKSDLTVIAKAFSKSDCKKYLDRDVIECGYFPVQISIVNNTETNYRFLTSRVSLPIASIEEVAEKVHTSTLGRSLGWGAAALLTSGIFIVPAIVDGAKSSHANEVLDRDFVTKAAKDHTILSHSHSNMLVFIPKGVYQQTFTIALEEEISKKTKVFKVTAPLR